MSTAKRILFSLAGLLVALIFLMFLLNLLGKLPVVGKFATDAKNLATSGSVNG